MPQGRCVIRKIQLFDSVWLLATLSTIPPFWQVPLPIFYEVESTGGRVLHRGGISQWFGLNEYCPKVKSVYSKIVAAPGDQCTHS